MTTTSLTSDDHSSRCWVLLAPLLALMGLMGLAGCAVGGHSANPEGYAARQE